MVRIAFLLAALAVSSVGCGKDSSQKAQDEGAKKEAPADEGAAEQPAPTPSGNEPIICCEYKGVIGTSTKSKCEAEDGKVLDLELPCKK